MRRIARLLYDGKLKPNEIDKGMVEKIAQQLMEGVFKGYGKTFESNTLSDKEHSFLRMVQENVYVFSGMKNYQQLRETSLLLRGDDGRLKPFKDFLDDVRQVNNTYNEVYLNAEYNNAVASAQTAASWQDYEANGIEYLRYQTAGDDRVRAEHAILEGTNLPIDDPFWDTYYPPNDWGCRCEAIPSVNEERTRPAKDELPELPDMFQNNVGKTGVLFPDTHPYYDANKAARAAVLQQVDDIIPPDTRADNIYESDTGGMVEAEQSVNKNELRDNKEIAQFLADLGHKVRLLGVNDAPGVKNPDALVDGKVFEFKTNKEATKSAIDNELRKAKKQADHIVLHIKSDISVPDLADAISDRMGRAKNVNEVWLIHDDNLIKLKKAELSDKQAIMHRIKKGDQH
jgi:SPP1 gp7 family putative phage head morphogenesis protein